jgi:hypothetical protein
VDEDGDVARALVVLRQALADAEQMEDSEAKTQRIRYLVTAIQELYGVGARIRKVEMIRVHKERSLSLKDLALALGVSKSLAQQAVNQVKEEKEKSSCAET